MIRYSYRYKNASQNHIIYEYPYVNLRVFDIEIQTGQGLVTLGSTDIMISCQLDEMQVFPVDHQQITNMMCMICSCLYFSQMKFVGNKITYLPTYITLSEWDYVYPNITNYSLTQNTHKHAVHMKHGSP